MTNRRAAAVRNNRKAGQGSLAIVCGGGTIPVSVAESARKAGRRVVLYPLRGVANDPRIAKYPHHWVAVGQIGRLARVIKSEGCRDVVFIGSIVRPSLWQIRFDWHSVRELPRLVAAFRGGDDHLLSSLGKIAESFGLRAMGAHEVAPNILLPAGTLTRKRPSARDYADIARGFKVLQSIGKFDVGQAVVVADSRVLAIEGIDGTDEMLAHLYEMRRRHRLRIREGIGVLVKAIKPGQNRRYDMPAVGPKTVIAAAKAGLAGIAVVAGETVVAEPERMIAAADRAKLFVVGVRKKSR